MLLRTSLVAQTVKRLAYNERDLGLIPGLGRSSGEGNGNPLQYSCLENPMDRGAWWATVHWVSKSRNDWATSLSLLMLLGTVIERPHQKQVIEVGKKESPKGGNTTIKGKMKGHRKGYFFTMRFFVKSGTAGCYLLNLHCAKFRIYHGQGEWNELWRRDWATSWTS